MRSPFWRKDKKSERELGNVVQHKGQPVTRHFLHVDMLSRGPMDGGYVVLVFSEDDEILDMLLYKSGMYVGHIDVTLPKERVTEILDSDNPEMHTDVCTGCLSPAPKDLLP